MNFLLTEKQYHGNLKEFTVNIVPFEKDSLTGSLQHHKLGMWFGNFSQHTQCAMEQCNYYYIIRTELR